MSDLTPLLRDWPYDSDEISVRRIVGLDGSTKIQLRLDLGVLQMEPSGRPDGKRPHGQESLLDYHETRLRNFQSQERPFALSPDECQELRQEGTQFYYRYLALFHLGDYAGAIRDTQRNLRLFEFLSEHAAQESDRQSVEQFRPYVLMMNTRARACLLLDDREYDLALEQIDKGIARIEDFLRKKGREELIEECRELQFLLDWRERILSNSPKGKLRAQLRIAIESEDYELAARLRDALHANIL